MIPFNDCYTIAHERDNTIRQAARPDSGPRRPHPPAGRTLVAALRDWLGTRPAPVEATQIQGTEPGR